MIGAGTGNGLSRRRFVSAGVVGLAGLVPGEPAGAEARRADSEPGLVELPGFVDLQVNGFAGVDFGDPANDAQRVLEAIAAIERTGVTRFLPTLITSSREDFAACARRVLRTRHPAIAGIHMEGPYISPEDGPRGAHRREHVRAADL
jgi:N-acetylglucosamine-6-phosphate deacetylase